MYFIVLLLIVMNVVGLSGIFLICHKFEIKLRFFKTE